jgi:hypothetical protein
LDSRSNLKIADLKGDQNHPMSRGPPFGFDISSRVRARDNGIVFDCRTANDASKSYNGVTLPEAKVDSNAQPVVATGR